MALPPRWTPIQAGDHHRPPLAVVPELPGGPPDAAQISLSFLGLGIRPPAVRWGALLKEGENIRILAHAPRLLIRPVRGGGRPGLQFVGDGLQDAADPYPKFNKI